MRTNEYTRLTPEEASKHRAAFNKNRTDLIKDWENNTGQVWPTYAEDVVSNSGTITRRVGQSYDAHHIIESSYGGSNEWWNIHPARFPDQHQGGIHRANGPARSIFDRDN